MLRNRPVQSPGRCLVGGSDLNVQAIRQKVGGTQSEFAALIGVPHGTLRKWQHRHRQPTGPARVLVRIAESDRRPTENRPGARALIRRMSGENPPGVRLASMAIGSSSASRSLSRASRSP